MKQSEMCISNARVDGINEAGTDCPTQVDWDSWTEQGTTLVEGVCLILQRNIHAVSISFDTGVETGDVLRGVVKEIGHCKGFRDVI